MDNLGDHRSVRAFVAVQVSDQVRETITAIENDLRRVGADVKWVEPHNLHLTLKFLGDTATEKLEGLCAALREAVQGAAAFDLTLAGAGTFPPGRRSVRVVWIGSAEGREALAELARRVEDACASQGFEKEQRPFSPHLTIGRVRKESRRLAELAAAVSEVRFNPLKLRIDRLNLIRSELSPKGPTYTVLERFSLEQT
jgi:2'-5' RNA ligase